MAWSHLCQPKEAGGLALRSLHTQVQAFSCKLWWRFRQGGSLWADFMQTRYCSSAHPNQVQLKPSASATWKRMLQARALVELHAVWDLRSGQVLFWWDNWLGVGPLAWQLPQSAGMEVVSDYWAEGGWDLGKLPRILPVEMLERIGSKFFCWKEGSNDELSWSATQSGRFTVSSAAELLRSDAGVSWVFKHVWVAGLLIRFSCLVWRLLHYNLPVADVLAKLTVRGPSRCYFCS